MALARAGRTAAAITIIVAATIGQVAGQTYPLTIQNCGYTLEIKAAPQRIVAIKSSSVDLLLALGLSEAIIGQAFLDGPPVAGFEALAQGIPVLSDRLPSREAVLEARPDFVFAGWESNLSGEGVGPRDVLAGFGVGSYVAPSACRSAQKPPKVTFERLFEEFEEAGRILGATHAASRLVEEQRGALAAIEPVGNGLKVAWYSSGSDVPYMGAGSGMPQAIMTILGLENIASNIDEGWSSISWEAIADAEPDIFVIADASWSPAQRKIAILESNPVIAQLDAVKRKRFLVVPFAATEAGVQSIGAAVELARQLSTIALNE